MEQYIIDSFQKHLIPLAGRWPQTLLHTGARNNATADWLLRYVLTSADDRYLGIDLHKPEIDASRRELGKWGTKVTLFMARAEIVLRQRIRPDLLFDKSVSIAYLDGDRGKRSVDTVARLLWPMVRTDGIVIWEHYRTTKPRFPEVCEPVDAFLAKHEHEVLQCGRQMIVKKA